MSFGDSWTAFFQRRQQNVWASPIYHHTSPLFHGYSSHIHQPLQFTPLNTTQLITLSRKLCACAKWPGVTKNRVIQSNEIQRMLTTLLCVKWRFYLSLRPRRTLLIGGWISHLGTLLFSQAVSCRAAEPKKELCVRNEWFIPATYSNCAHYAVNLTPGLLWLIRSKMGKIQWRVKRKLNNWMRATDVGTLQTGRSGWILSTTLVPVPSQIISGSGFPVTVRVEDVAPSRSVPADKNCSFCSCLCKIIKTLNPGRAGEPYVPSAACLPQTAYTEGPPASCHVSEAAGFLWMEITGCHEAEDDHEWLLVKQRALPVKGGLLGLLLEHTYPAP